MIDSKVTIPAVAIVRDEQSSVANSLREVAREAARQWGQAQMTGAWSDPEGFGKAVAQVYLSALADINAGFAPDVERPEGRA